MQRRKFLKSQLIHLKKSSFLLVFILLACANELMSQQSSEWSAITSYNTINSITQISDGTIWGVSDGGLFSFTDNDFDQRLTPVDGMYRLDGRTIYYVKGYDLLVIGYIDGMIDIFDPKDQSFARLEDIRRVQAFSSRGINSILFHDDRIYIATEFGVVVYNPSTFLVSQSFTKIGSFDRGTPVFDLDIAGDTIFLATQQGIAYANLQDNLNLDTSWTNYSQAEGLPGGSVQSVAYFNDKIYASTSSENLIYQDGVWQVNETYSNQQNINYRRDFATELLVAHNHQRIFFTDAQNSTQALNLPSSGISDVYYDDQLTSTLYISSTTLGMGIAGVSNMDVDFIASDGPNLNFFEGMSFDQSAFVSGTTRRSQLDALMDNAKGYYIVENGEWENFNMLNNEELRQNRFRLGFTSAFNDDYYYIGSWGSGIARHHRETGEITVYNADNSTLRGWAADDPNFPVITGLETDSDGAVWATSRYATNPLYVQLPGENEWINYGKSSAIGTTDEYVGLFIDSNNQKWITLQGTGRAGRGLLLLDTGEPETTGDAFGIKLTDDVNNGNLPNMSVTDIIEDRDGEVWIGTERGISRFIFPQFIITGSQEERRAQWLINEDPDAESPFLLRDINVSAMAVNSANQKWVGTAGEGVWLLNESGSAILKHYNTDNSPLFSNVIRDIEINDVTGEVYISTELGLSIYQDTPTAPVTTMDELKVYPNPFVYDRHNTIFVENLSETTTIRVLGIDGTLVRTLDNRGGRAEWDGLDSRGRQVGSGVYVVVALSSGGSERGTGKVVIIR